MSKPKSVKVTTKDGSYRVITYYWLRPQFGKSIGPFNTRAEADAAASEFPDDEMTVVEMRIPDGPYRHKKETGCPICYPKRS